MLETVHDVFGKYLSNAFVTDKFVDAFGSNSNKLAGAEGWRHDGKPQLVHERHLGVVPPGPNPTTRGYERHPEDCKGMFSVYTQALRDRDLPEEDMKQMGLSGAT